MSLVENGHVPGHGHGQHTPAAGQPQPSAAKYMKRFLSPSSTDRQTLGNGKEVSNQKLKPEIVRNRKICTVPP